MDFFRTVHFGHEPSGFREKEIQWGMSEVFRPYRQSNRGRVRQRGALKLVFAISRCSGVL